MQPLRGIADDDATPRAGALSTGERQRVRDPPADLEETAEAKSKSSLYLGEKPVATEPKPKAHRVVAKVPAPPPAPYQVEMIRGSKRDETKFEENK